MHKLTIPNHRVLHQTLAPQLKCIRLPYQAIGYCSLPYLHKTFLQHTMHLNTHIHFNCMYTLPDNSWPNNVLDGVNPTVCSLTWLEESNIQTCWMQEIEQQQKLNLCQINTYRDILISILPVRNWILHIKQKAGRLAKVFVAHHQLQMRIYEGAFCIFHDGRG